jgi:hypothetical protein
MTTKYSVTSINYRSTQENDHHSIVHGTGDPPVQERSRMGGQPSSKKRNIYDPSASNKKNWKTILHNSLFNAGASTFPFFDSQYTHEKKCKGLQVEVCFCLPRNKNDYHVSSGKLVLKSDHQLYPSRKTLIT